MKPQRRFSSPSCRNRDNQRPSIRDPEICRSRVSGVADSVKNGTASVKFWKLIRVRETLVEACATGSGRILPVIDERVSQIS